MISEIWVSLALDDEYVEENSTRQQNQIPPSVSNVVIVKKKKKKKIHVYLKNADKSEYLVHFLKSSGSETYSVKENDNNIIQKTKSFKNLSRFILNSRG